MTSLAPTFGGDRTLRTIPLDQIEVGDRLRVIADDYVQMLAESVRQIGLTTPIEVRPIEGGRYRLIFGGHRYAAVKLAGQTEIAAFVADVDEVQARIREIAENLYRHELNAYDRGRHFDELQVLYEAINPDTRQGVAGGKARQNSATDIVSFAENTALATGYSARTVQRAINMYRNLAPAVRERLAGSEIARDQSQLIALSKLAPADQVKVVRMLLAPDVDRPRKVKDALAILNGKRAEPRSADDKAFQQLVAVWKHRSTKRARDAFLNWLRENGEI